MFSWSSYFTAYVVSVDFLFVLKSGNSGLCLFSFLLVIFFIYLFCYLFLNLQSEKWTNGTEVVSQYNFQGRSKEDLPFQKGDLLVIQHATSVCFFIVYSCMFWIDFLYLINIYLTNMILIYWFCDYFFSNVIVSPVVVSYSNFVCVAIYPCHYKLGFIVVCVLESTWHNTNHRGLCVEHKSNPPCKI